MVPLLIVVGVGVAAYAASKLDKSNNCSKGMEIFVKNVPPEEAGRFLKKTLDDARSNGTIKG